MLTPEMMMMRNPAGGIPAWTGGVLANASYDSKSLSVGSYDGTPGPGLAFGDDGNKLYVRGVTGNDILMWDLSTAYDISSASGAPDATGTLTPTGGFGLSFSPDGVYYYSIGQTSGNLHRYEMSTPWDLSTASDESNYSPIPLNGYTNPKCSHVSYTGEYFYVCMGAAVNQYTLSTAFDITSSSLSHDISFTDTELGSNTWDCYMAPDGLNFYALSFSPAEVNRFTLSTPYDLDTATYSEVFSLSSQEALPRGVAFSPDGEIMIACGQINDTVYQYEVVA